MEIAFRVAFYIAMAVWIVRDVQLIWLMVVRKRSVQEHFWVQVVKIPVLMGFLVCIFLLPPDR